MRRNDEQLSGLGDFVLGVSRGVVAAPVTKLVLGINERNDPEFINRITDLRYDTLATKVGYYTGYGAITSISTGLGVAISAAALYAATR